MKLDIPVFPVLDGKSRQSRENFNREFVKGFANGGPASNGKRIMARPKPSTFDKQKVVAENRRARFDFAIEEKFEAGIALQGTEVKALRAGQATIAESYAEVRDGEVWLVNSNIPEFSHGNRNNHEPKRPRKLLLKTREIDKLFGAVERKGMTLVPLSIYFNATGRAKVELALAKGKQAHDKRQTVKDRDWKRDKARLMRERG
jgi:SsrA-binding protein